MNAYNVTIFGMRFKLNPIAFTIPIGKNGWDIYWYGIIIAVGFLLAVIYAYKAAKRYNVNLDRMLDVILVTTPLAILCARAYYVLFDPDGSVSSIKEFFGFGTNSGFAGIAIYGGVIGALIFGTAMCYIRKVNVLDMYDIAAVGFLLAQGIGRWGNFINQEAYGSLTGSSFWGMTSERTVYEMGEGLVHPCFLYESIWCIAGFFVLNHFSKSRKFKGEIALLYGVWYGLGRGIIECLRTDSLMIGRIKVSVLVSGIFFIACALTLVIILNKLKSENKGEYDKIFDTDNKEEEQSDAD